MSDAAAREWRVYIDDMIAFAEKVIAYTDGFDRDRFIASGLNYDATLRNLAGLGGLSGAYGSAKLSNRDRRHETEAVNAACLLGAVLGRGARTSWFEPIYCFTKTMHSKIASTAILGSQIL
jgi:hypothetical protein